MTTPGAAWRLYVLRCNDGSLYTGITTDLERRLREHTSTGSNSRGAKYLRGKQPLTLVFTIELENQSEARRMEYIVKQLSKTEKEALVSSELNWQELVSRKSNA